MGQFYPVWAPTATASGSKLEIPFFSRVLFVHETVDPFFRDLFDCVACAPNLFHGFLHSICLQGQVGEEFLVCPFAAVRRLFGWQPQRLFDEREIEMKQERPMKKQKPVSAPL